LRSTFDEVPATPNQLRWSRLPSERAHRLCAGNPDTRRQRKFPDHTGFAIHIYVANHSMTRRLFHNADGRCSLFPSSASAVITEMGVLEVAACEICVIQRGIKFRVELPDGQGRGYICENYGGLFACLTSAPSEPIVSPTAAIFSRPSRPMKDQEGHYESSTNFKELWSAEYDHSPLDVVGWHGNYAPTNTISTASIRLVPSASTIPTVDLHRADGAVGDSGHRERRPAVFPSRWLVAEHTFRPPGSSQFHERVHGPHHRRIRRQGGRLCPGGTACTTAWPATEDAAPTKRQPKRTLKPVHLSDTMAFMFETRYVVRPTKVRMDTPNSRRVL